MPLLLIQPSCIVWVHEKLTPPARPLPSVHAAILASTLARLARTEAFPRPDAPTAYTPAYMR